MYWGFRGLAAELRQSSRDTLGDAINVLFAKNGKPQIPFRDMLPSPRKKGRHPSANTAD
jgi:hypothetical protein